MLFFSPFYFFLVLESVNCIGLFKLCFPKKLERDVVNIPYEIPEVFELADNSQSNQKELLLQIKNFQSANPPKPVDKLHIIDFTSPKNMEQAFHSTMKYLNKRKPTIIYRPKNIPRTTICDPRVNIGEYLYRNFSTTTMLGRGIQGSVYKMKNGAKQCIAYKIFTQLSDFLMQVNAMIALQSHFPQYRIYAIEQNYHNDNSDWFYNDEVNTLDLKAPYCMVMTYLKGDPPELIMKNTYLNMKTLKRNFRMLILLLKQLQVLHFSFNHYPVVRDSDIFGAFTFTMFHGDLHGSNILMTRDETSKQLYPQMIDVGYKFEMLISGQHNLFDLYYNYHLLNEKLPIEERKKNIVLKDQFMNELQTIDLCMLGMMILTFFIGDLGIGNAPIVPCIHLQRSLDVAAMNREMHQTFYFHFHFSPYWPLLALFLHSRRVETSYADAWLKLSNMLFANRLNWGQ
ncbi:hypothetical protein SNEBB_000070 [Seison nebaliae]|nr:hypothetical protein SNEBB_000070 [Seison nebaliae]